MPKKTPAVNMNRKTMVGVYLDQEQLNWLDAKKAEGKIPDRGRFFRAVLDFIIEEPSRLKEVMEGIS